MIVATDSNGGIGKNHHLPWPHNQDDMDWFVGHTRGKIVVMGRHTWESLPKKPLPHRVNIVVTKGFFDDATICLTSGDRPEVLIEKLAIIAEGREVVVIGGAQLYQSLFPYVTKIYHTRFNQEYACDTFFSVEEAVKDSPRQWRITQMTVQGGLVFQVLESQPPTPSKGA
jgi:dihydrofolate reductase